MELLVPQEVIGQHAATQSVSPLRIYWLAALSTLLIWAVVGGLAGWIGLISVITLTVLEVTFSFDNAVVNSKLLKHMSPAWQRAFMTAGIFIAVFVVRFALPILIVQLTAHLGFTDVVRLAVDQPAVYAQHLTEAGPMIDAFGGTFLLMIGIGYFLDAEKDVHWIGWLERRLAPLGRFDNVPIFVMALVALVLFFAVDGSERAMVLVAAVAGIALHVGLDLFASIFEVQGGELVLVGAGAAVMFLRLEILDGSFSFDGVIGAFAITTSVLIIMAGLGAGAMWVRAMTVHLVRAGTLAKYCYLEHGAHWAIFFLGAVMIAKLFHVEPPGLVFIALAVVSSVVHERRRARAEMQGLHFAPIKEGAR
jgi:hypothetical protein